MTWDTENWVLSVLTGVQSKGGEMIFLSGQMKLAAIYGCL